MGKVMIHEKDRGGGVIPMAFKNCGRAMSI